MPHREDIKIRLKLVAFPPFSRAAGALRWRGGRRGVQGRRGLWPQRAGAVWSAALHQPELGIIWGTSSPSGERSAQCPVSSDERCATRSPPGDLRQRAAQLRSQLPIAERPVADDSALPLHGISWRSVRTGRARMASVARPTPTMSRALAGRVESENLAVHPRPALETGHATVRVQRRSCGTFDRA